MGVVAKVLQLAKAYLEAYSAEVLDVRHLVRMGEKVITIDAKLPEGNVATFQLRGSNLYRQYFNHKTKDFISDKIVFQFSS